MPRRHLHLVPRGRPRPLGLRVGGSDPHSQLDLYGVGVLELVEQQALVALVRVPADVRPAQHGPGQYQQVVELELPGGPALRRRRQGEAAQDGGHLAGTGLGHLTPNGV